MGCMRVRACAGVASRQCVEAMALALQLNARNKTVTTMITSPGRDTSSNWRAPEERRASTHDVLAGSKSTGLRASNVVRWVEDPAQFATEQDIFRFVHAEYLEPEERCA